MKKIIIVSLVCGLLNVVAVDKPQQEKPQKEKPQIEKPTKPMFPRHWGKPPEIQTRDMVELPGKFGKGSSTLANWIKENLKSDAQQNKSDKKDTKQEKPKKPIKPFVPSAPSPHNKIPADIKENMDSFKSEQSKLNKALQSKIKDLGKKPTKEAVRKVVEKFRADNQDKINAQKELGKSIQQWQKDNRTERPKRPEPSTEVKEKMTEVRTKKKEMDEIRKTFQETLKASKDLTKEQREELIKEFKEKNAEKHQAIKEAQKELQKEIRETTQDGDRRK
jgi:hypothetical protein